MPTVPSSQLVAVNGLGQNTPADPSRVGLVIGPTAAGTPNQILLDDSLSTIEANFDSGPGSEEAATALVEPGAGTVYQIKSPSSTAGTIGSVTKTAGATVGAVVDAFGSVLVPGVDFNGDVLFTAKAEGAELEIINGGAEAVTVTGLHVRLTSKVGTTTGTSLAALITGNVGAAALWGVQAIGTGASNNSTTLSTFAETAGRIGIQALKSGLQARVTISGNNTPRSVVLTGGNIVDITEATNAHGEPAATETALSIQSDLATLAANNPGVFRTTLAGSGTGLLGALALVSLPFGSTGAMTVSGSPNDAYQVSVQVSLAGALGAAGITVSLGNAQGLPLYSGNYLIPSGGVLALPDTGLTLTFTGSFDLGDTFTFSTTSPLSTLSDIVSALTYFAGRPEHASLVQIAGEIPVVNLPAWVVALQSLADSMAASLTLPKYLGILLEYAPPSVGQTNAQWASQVTGVLAPLAAPRISVFGGEGNAAAALPLPQPGRFEVVNGSRFMFARALSLSAGIDVVDQTQSGTATGVLQAYQTDAAAALAAARSSYFFLLSGTPGVQIDFVMLDSPTGDYTRGVIRRVIDKVSFYASIFQTKYVGTRQQRNQDGTLAQTSRIAIQDDLNAKLKKVVVDTGDCQSVTSVVNGMNTDGRLLVTYYVQIFFYVYNIFGRVGVTKTFAFTL
jgi:hypothetical protein